jgi:1-acyl-sn-glycerol-3-phosphate acyltransferase
MPQQNLPSPASGSTKIWVRSVIFEVLFLSATVLACLFACWTLLLPRRYLLRIVRSWEHVIVWLERYVIGIHYEIVGTEYLPEGAYIIAAQHQSTWETLKFHIILEDPAIVIKQELMTTPIVGRFLRHAGMIPVDRSNPVRAIILMIRTARSAVREGRPIVIFPQGTRVSPGEAAPYKAGVAALYRDLCLPVVPMTLNSGSLWPKRSLLKRPGTITLTFFPAIAPGLDRTRLLRELLARFSP